MIVWIASYPKSGNTWVRALLSAYLNTDNGYFEFKNLRKIDQFPSKEFFDFFLKDFNDIKKVSDYWIAAQDRINLYNENITFLKTHSALCTLENNSFTDKKNTKAVIYIVRDPRNLITSFSHHYGMNIKDTYEFITNVNQILTGSEWGGANFGIATVLGNWAEHYKSWKRIKFAPFLLIKYEDLIKDTKGSLTQIINFLSNFMNIEKNEEKILNTVNSCKFDRLALKEKEEGFFEAVSPRKDDKKVNFFYLGKKNNWKDLLDPEIEKKIREIFNKEMKDLNYI